MQVSHESSPKKQPSTLQPSMLRFQILQKVQVIAATCKKWWRLGQNLETHFESLLLRHGPAHSDTLPGGGGSIFRWHYRSSRQEEGGISSWRISAGLAMFEVLEQFNRFTNLGVLSIVVFWCRLHAKPPVRCAYDMNHTCTCRFTSKVAVAVQISLTYFHQLPLLTIADFNHPGIIIPLLEAPHGLLTCKDGW